MSRLIVVSNKLPYEIVKTDEGLQMKEKDVRTPSKLSSFYNLQQCDWVGWTGNEQIEMDSSEKERVRNLFESERCHPIYLTTEEIEKYNYGFCNATLWPLFHYFTQYSEFREDFWESYKAVNQKFASKVLEIARKDDTIWINDYHLLLLPKMLRDVHPELTIGFFLHIPFPSFEIFRTLPWRREIVEGMLGADLVGFHTFDYERHFMSSVRRLLGIDNMLNTVKLDERVVKIDNFPIGIDYDYYHKKSAEFSSKGSESILGLGKDFISRTLNNGETKLMLSIDRLDYAKGIDRRLEAYEMFLNVYPQYLEKICLALFVIPSREVLVEYQAKKRMVDELVGRINGQYGTVGWMPILYFYRYLTRDEKIEMYSVSDIALVTPLRDGMNLIAKEYIASRTDKTGVLILSEMTGAAKEMSESLQVNPNNAFEMAEAIKQAMEMPIVDQIQSNEVMQKRLQLYNEQKWATDILSTLKSVKKLQETNLTRKISPRIIDEIKGIYREAENRIIFLDYDGTLTGFHKDPQMATPNEELYAILRKLVSKANNKVVVISGRDKETLGKWFSKFDNVTFIAEHGVWIKVPQTEWSMMENIDKNWMDIIRPIINFYADRTPRSFLEEKNYSLVWHYRNSDPDLGEIRAWELKDELRDLVSNLNLEIMDGDKVIEVKNSGINKGRAASQQLANGEYQFIMAIGDDWTDEYTFGAMPQHAYTIKVGTKNTKANYYIESVEKVRQLLNTLGDV